MDERNVGCDQDKVRNPVTRRCVTKTGKIGKATLAARRIANGRPSPVRPTAPVRPVRPTAPVHPVRPTSPKKCLPGYLLNPATGRCVLRTGKIGRALLAGNTVPVGPDPPFVPPSVAPDPPFVPTQNDENHVIDLPGMAVRIRKTVKQCADVRTFEQKYEICWFMAVMMAVFGSKGMRMALGKSLPTMARKPRKKDAAIDMADLLAGYDVTNQRVPKHVFDTLEPHRFLKLLAGYDSGLFHNDGLVAGLPTPYLRKFLEFAELTHFFVERPKAGSRSCVSSVYNYDLPYNSLVPSRWATTKLGGYVTSKAPKVLAVVDGEEFYTAQIRRVHQAHVQAGRGADVVLGRTRHSIEGIKDKEHARTLKFAGHTYDLDSMILRNKYSEACSIHHGIAGVTCNGKRFMYNGWTRSTKDRGMGGGVTRRTVCPLMEVDWAKSTLLVIADDKCQINPVTPENLKNNSGMKFATMDATVIYVRRD